MPIIGLSFSSIEAKRKAVPKGEIKVNSAPGVLQMKETDPPGMGQKALALEFEFKTVYEPDVGSIILAGEMVYATENNSKIMAQWKKNKTLPDDVSVEVLNHLFRRCLLKSSNIAEELQLPIPLNMPKVEAKKKE